MPAGSPYSRFIAVPRQDDAHLAFRIEDATGGWSAWSHVDPERASSGGLLSDGRATGLREYVAPVKAATPDVTALVNRVNAARRAEYEKVARQNGTQLSDVEVLAARKILDRVPSGTYVQGSGGWTRK